MSGNKPLHQACARHSTRLLKHETLQVTRPSEQNIRLTDPKLYTPLPASTAHFVLFSVCALPCAVPSCVEIRLRSFDVTKDELVPWLYAQCKCQSRLLPMMLHLTAAEETLMLFLRFEKNYLTIYLKLSVSV